jgi:hypothetical protein
VNGLLYVAGTGASLDVFDRDTLEFKYNVALHSGHSSHLCIQGADISENGYLYLAADASSACPGQYHGVHVYRLMGSKAFFAHYLPVKLSGSSILHRTTGDEVEGITIREISIYP